MNFYYKKVMDMQKKLVKHLQAWRSPEFQQYIESLDRKIDRRRTCTLLSVSVLSTIGSISFSCISVWTYMTTCTCLYYNSLENISK